MFALRRRSIAQMCATRQSNHAQTQQTWAEGSQRSWMENVAETYSESATAGITPSIIFSSLGSLPETSQMIILPSAPHVV